MKHYGAVTALNDFNLTVPNGSIFGFLGPNGAGKTTTIRILLGLIRPSAGTATVFGLDSWRDSTAIRKRVGYLPGDLRLYDGMSGKATLDFFVRARGPDSRAEMQRLCERFELNRQRRFRQYSKGNKQKLGIIQALMHRPDVLILDEPTSALDPLVQQTLYDEIRLAAERGTTVLFSSHTLSEVESLCSRVAIIAKGRLVECDDLDALRARAPRRIEYVPTERTPPPPPQLQRAHFATAAEGRIVGTWQGDIQPLIEWLRTSFVRDIVLAPPDLEQLFLSYYGYQAPVVVDSGGAR